MGKRLDLLQGTWKEDYSGKKRASPEASVGKAVDAYLKTLGAYCRTIKSDGTKTKDGWRRSAQGAGISDRLCWLPNGMMLAVELKAPGKKRTLTTDQYNFLLQLLKRGHRACVADCVEDVKKALAGTLPELLLELDKWKPRTELVPSLFDLEPLFP
jgi:hypothetical protein